MEGRNTRLGDVLPPRVETFLWHGDSYDLADGAAQIARSVAFEKQGLVWNHVLALQFHLEGRPEWVQMLAKRDARELVPARFVQSAEEILSNPDGLYRENNALSNRLLRRWRGHVQGQQGGCRTIVGRLVGRR